MARKAMLVNYYWCTGCHSCELACQSRHFLPESQYGIKLNKVGPWEYGNGKWEFEFFPVLTKQCTLCADRTKVGKLPSCVQHCQANCLQILDAEDAAVIAAKNPKMMMMTR